MREWLSGGAPPCQGGGRGFDPRLALSASPIPMMPATINFILSCAGIACYTTCGCSSMVEHQPSKLDTWVRFPSPAFCVRSRHTGAVGKRVIYPLYFFGREALILLGSRLCHVINMLVQFGMTCTKVFYLNKRRFRNIFEILKNIID